MTKHEYWGMRYRDNKKMVMQDQNSGGYPDATEPRNAHFWTRREDAEKYLRMFPELELVKITIFVEEI